MSSSTGNIYSQYMPKAKFAALVEVTKATISACVTRKTIICNFRGKVDLCSPATIKYIKKREKKLGKPILSRIQCLPPELAEPHASNFKPKEPEKGLSKPIFVANSEDGKGELLAHVSAKANSAPDVSSNSTSPLRRANPTLGSELGRQERGASPSGASGKASLSLDSLDDCLDPTRDIDVDAFLNLEHGSDEDKLDTLKRVVDIRHKLMDTRLRMLRLAVHREELVDRRTVGMVGFKYLDNLNKRVLNVPVQIVDQVIAMVQRSGLESREDIVDLIVEELGKAVRNARDEMKRLVDSSPSSKEEDDEVIEDT